MTIQQNLAAKVTTLVFDYMLIQLNEISLSKPSVHYRIANAFGRLIREGFFINSSMQLRLSHLDDGDYSIQLTINGSEALSYNFTKLASALTFDRRVPVKPYYAQ